MLTLTQGLGSTRPAEVDFTGTVASTPTFFWGSRTHAEHETFDVEAEGRRVHVVDNVLLAPRVPVAVGDQVEIRGELVHDRHDGSPLVHWTHHDPAGSHPDGFIRWQGKTYA